eukprot:1362216-Amphidinium_carterae.1
MPPALLPSGKVYASTHTFGSLVVLGNLFQDESLYAQRAANTGVTIVISTIPPFPITGRSKIFLN